MVSSSKTLNRLQPDLKITMMQWIALPPHRSKVLGFNPELGFCHCSSCLPPVSSPVQTHICRWNSSDKLPINHIDKIPKKNVNTCVNRACTGLVSHPIRGGFLPHSQCSLHILWIPCVLYQNKDLTQDEEGKYILFIHSADAFVHS